MIIATTDDSTILILTGISLTTVFHKVRVTLRQAVEKLLGLAFVVPLEDPF